MNQNFQNAIQRIPQNTPPIWFMRQAGRYHKHYQALRAKHSFEQLCKIPELAAEVAMGPIEDFDFDVAILFSDILFPLEGFGMGLEYTDQGPRLEFQLDANTIQRLGTVEKAVEFMSFQHEAMKITRERLPKNKSLIGFIGGPWTLFVYAVEGSHAGSLTKSKNLLPLFPVFMEKMLPMLMKNIDLQLKGGAETVMIFDTAAGEVSPAIFQSYIQPILEKIVQKFPNKVGYYSKHTQRSFFNQDFLNQSWTGMGFDHRWNLPETMNIRQSGFIQGNFDQSLLFMDTDQLKKELNQYLAPYQNLTQQQRAGWVCGLGHGVLPKTPEAHVHLFIETVRKVFA